MNNTEIYERVGSWLDGSGPMSDIVISSRIRLARNLADARFCAQADDLQRQEVHDFIQKQIFETSLRDDLLYRNFFHTPDLEKQMLFERHVISKQLAENAGCCGVAFTLDESLSLMINEEDHLRIQILASGLQLSEQYDRIARVDNMLEEKIHYAFSSRYGFLTACPTNVGTGIRVSVMLHLPALKMSGQLEKVFRAAKDMHLAVRGLYGEGSEPVGDFYQLSNQITLGKSEKQIIDELIEYAVEPIVKYERVARQKLLEERCCLVEDKIFRALGLLRHARLITSDEALYMLSFVRLGIHLGKIKDVTLNQVNYLLQLTRPAHLQHLNHKALDPAERDEVRASFIRKILT